MSTSGCNGTRFYKSLHTWKRSRTSCGIKGMLSRLSFRSFWLFLYTLSSASSPRSDCTTTRTRMPTNTLKHKHTRTNKQKRAQSDLSPKHKFPAREPIPRGCAQKIRRFGRTRSSSACALLTLLFCLACLCSSWMYPQRTSPPVGGRENMGRSGRRIAGA